MSSRNRGRLEDSFKLNRQRFSETKFEDENVGGLAGNALTPGSSKKKLLNFLSEAKECAEDEKSSVYSQVGSQSIRKRFDWEHLHSDEEEEPMSASTARMSVFSDRTGRSGKIEVEEKNKTIEALKNALEKSRNNKAELLKQSQDENQKMLDKQRTEHEKAVARHLAFIDKLLGDKKQLAGKVEELTTKMKKSEDSLIKRIQFMEEQHKKDIVTAKEVMANIDMQKRQKWQKEKAKELKEVTIKGLEPEIQNILAKHKDDLRSMEDNFKEELRTIETKAENDKNRAIQKVKSDHLLELDQLKSSDRSTTLEKVRGMEKRHQEELEKQRLRYEADFEEFRKRQSLENKRSHEQLDDRIAEAIKLKDLEMLEQKRRLEIQIESLEQKWSIEKEHWQSKVLGKIHEKSQQEEKKLRDRLVQERDSQLDDIINKLHNEQEGKLENLTRRHEMETKDFFKQMDFQKEEFEKLEQEYKSRIEHLEKSRIHEKRTFSSAESRVRDLEAMAEKREARIVELSKKVSCINDLLSDKEAEIRSEYVNKNANFIQSNSELQGQIEQLKIQLETESKSFKQKLNEMQTQFDDETEDIHRRVRTTLGRKDETIETLHAEIRQVQEELNGYEMLLDKQRKEFINS